MGTAGWGSEWFSNQAVSGEVVEEDEDHMAGLVQQIARVMLEEDDDDGLSRSKSPWEQHSVPQYNRLQLEKSESMELLYMELVRLKMEELAVAQHQLSLYQKALMDARFPLRPGCTSLDNTSQVASRFSEQHQLALDMSCGLLRQGQSGRREWASSQTMQSPGSKPRIAAPVINVDGICPGRLVPSIAPRESGGTGVFLPRCRAGARQLRALEGKKKPDVQFPIAAGCPKSAVPLRKKDDMVKTVKHSAFSPVPELSPEICLPTEWTY